MSEIARQRKSCISAAGSTALLWTLRAGRKSSTDSLRRYRVPEGSLLIGVPRFDDYSFACRYGMTQDEFQEYYDRYAASDGFGLRIRHMQPICGVPEGGCGCAKSTAPR
jgi:hypothetical protein